ncbi:MAG: tripartite tricarboxylate transporter substrate binding protein [Clostridia bacterium]|uniref:tripartite tricarboxylate transporter substrate binding protein n=1 Tax=Cloacibacillus porcorum TaxID=1197717 RepID=UPI002354C8B2|nr:tripartite tricarboxylate transporter substrate binding protein [Cloacibacillus porcorum]MCI5863666.1 tripartite tricarboxylate transporter substrate binding protein [Cloacibacillus porcorum]MCI7303525.1 tripartite tricarboxylate transporter substrate binding protein [Clostridia bacterium]
MKKLAILGIFILLLAISVFASPGKLCAAEWPSGKVTMLIPFKAGGSSDSMGRGLAKYWEKYLGVPIVIDNRDGASSQVGTTIYSRLPADGNTIYLGCQVYFSSNILTHNAKYKFDQFEVINIQQEDAIELVVLNDSKYKDVKSLFDAIRKNPGTLKGGYIAGGPQNIAASILRKEYGLNFKSITYDNGNALRTALLGEHLDFMIGNSSGDISVAGKAKILVILGTKRSGLFPSVPTFAEAFDGKQFPDLSMSTFIAVHSDLKKKHPERYQKLLDTYKQALNDPEYKKFLVDSKQAPINQYIGPEKSAVVNRSIHELVEKYKDELVVKH